MIKYGPTRSHQLIGDSLSLAYAFANGHRLHKMNDIVDEVFQKGAN